MYARQTLRRVAAVAMVTVLPTIVSAQVARVSVSDSSGGAIPGLEVRLITFDSMRVVAVAKTSTDDRSPLLVAGPPAGRRYTDYIVAACADGWRPQVFTAPFARGDTLELTMRLARAASRGEFPVGPGACAWQVDSVWRIQVTKRPNFVTRAARTILALDSLEARARGDSMNRLAYVRAVLPRLDAALQNARTRDDRARAAFMRLRFQLRADTSLGDTMRAQLRAALPADSRWWTLGPFYVQGMTGELFGTPDGDDQSAGAVSKRDAARAYLARMAATLGEPETQSAARYELIRLTKDAGDTATAQALLGRLLREQGEYPWARLAAMRFSPATPLRAGAKMPAFEVLALPDTSAPHITNATIRGKLTLINFWGTWCGPCRAELPTFARAYAKYHARGLEMLSIAADESPDVVNQFQRMKGLIIWASGYGGPVEAPTFHRLGIVQFPRTVIVDANGIIVAATGKIGEAELTTLIERSIDHLPAAGAPR